MATAEQARGRYVRLADRAARLYAPAVHILGAATFLGWLLAGQGWESALTAAIAVLIITCPCALALAVPAVQVAADQPAVRASGVLLKAPDGLERLAEVDTVVFDKTGTLTLGHPRSPTTRASATRCSAAARLAAGSRHPYARAVVRAAEARGLPCSRRRRARSPGLRSRARRPAWDGAAGLGRLVRRRSPRVSRDRVLSRRGRHHDAIRIRGPAARRRGRRDRRAASGGLCHRAALRRSRRAWSGRSCRDAASGAGRPAPCRPTRSPASKR